MLGEIRTVSDKRHTLLLSAWTYGDTQDKQYCVYDGALIAFFELVLRFAILTTEYNSVPNTIYPRK